MNGPLLQLPKQAMLPAVQDFAVAKGINRYLSTVLELAQQAFPSSTLAVSLGQDAEDDSHQYIAIDIEAGSLTAEELLAGQRIWSTELAGICPSRLAVYFVLGWR